MLSNLYCHCCKFICREVRIYGHVYVHLEIEAWFTFCLWNLISGQIFGTFVSLVFLGQAFTIMLVYVWSRRNPNVRMNFFGLLNFQAPFLPWVLMGFSLLLGNSIIVDLLGRKTPGTHTHLHYNITCATSWRIFEFECMLKLCSLYSCRYCRGTCLFLPGGCVPQSTRWQQMVKDSYPSVSGAPCANSIVLIKTHNIISISLVKHLQVQAIEFS